MVVAADETGAERRTLVHPLGTLELSREPSRQIDVDHELPHALYWSGDDDIHLRGGPFGVLHQVSSRPR